MVDSNSDCRYSCGVYNHEKLPMSVNSSYSFSYGPRNHGQCFFDASRHVCVDQFGDASSHVGVNK